MLVGVRAVEQGRALRGRPPLAVGGGGGVPCGGGGGGARARVDAPRVLAAAIIASFPYLLLGESNLVVWSKLEHVGHPFVRARARRSVAAGVKREHVSVERMRRVAVWSASFLSPVLL